MRTGVLVGAVVALLLTIPVVAEPSFTLQQGHASAPARTALDEQRALAVSSTFDAVKLWDLRTGLLVHTFETPAPVFAADVARGRFATLSGDVMLGTAEVLIWSMASRSHIRIEANATALAFAPDGALLFVGKDDGSLAAFDASSGAPAGSLLPLFEDLHAVTELAVSHDGSALAAAARPNMYQPPESFDASIAVVDVGAWSERLRLPSGRPQGENGSVFYEGDPLVGIALSEDGSRLFEVEADRVRTWDTQTGEPGAAASLPVSSASRPVMAVDGKGQRLARAETPSRVAVYEIATGAELWSAEAHGERVSSVAFSLLGGSLITGGTEANGRHEIARWDGSSGQETWRSNAAEQPSVKRGMFSPDGHRLALLAGRGLHVWSLTAARREAFVAFDGEPSALAFHPSSGAIAVAVGKRIVRVDAESGALVEELERTSASDVTGLGFTREGSRLIAEAGDRVRVWDESTGALTLELAAGAANLGALSRDRGFFVNAKGGDVRVVSILDGSTRIISAPDLTERLAVSTGGRFVAGVGVGASSVVLVDTSTGQRTSIPTLGPLELAFDASATHLMVGGQGSVIVWNIPEARAQHVLSVGDDVTEMQLSADNRTLMLEVQNLHAPVDLASVQWWDIETGSKLHEVPRRFAARMLHPSGQWAALAQRGATDLLRLQPRAEPVMTLVSLVSDWAAYTPDGIFDASRAGGESIAMTEGLQAYGVDQFALVTNRPDILLERLESPDTELIEHFASRYARRVRRFQDRLRAAGAEGELPEPSFTLHTPEARIVSSAVIGEEVELELRFEDTAFELAFFNLFVNDVPLYAGLGEPLTGSSAERTVRVPLTAGINKVEASAVNRQGAESYRPLVFVESEEAGSGGALYFLGFGVSDYADDSLDLGYAAKDARDLAEHFESASKFSAVYTRTYTDAEVTRASITEARTFLEQAGVEDTVVLFIAGHGLHERTTEATYYYLTHDTDLENLAGTAAPFDTIEGLLDGLAARRKLFLMDTCESGELSDEVYGVAETLEEGVRSRGLPRATVARERKPRRFLQDRARYIYNDLNRRTGAIVFSSSRGGELSYENTRYENGFFTEALLEAMSGAKADSDGDGDVSSEELRAYVSARVPEMSHELQHPTVDRDNLFVRLSLTGAGTSPALPRTAPGAGGCACVVTASPRTPRGTGVLWWVVLMWVWRVRRRV